MPYDFGGPDITPDDTDRLASVLARVTDLMSDKCWRTLAEIAEAVGCSEAGASARLRDLRKKHFGSHTVERQRVTGGLWEYRVLLREKLVAK